MGESDRYQDYRKTSTRRFTLGQPGNALFALFAANVGAFFLILLFNVFTLYAQQGQDNSNVSALHWFALPANLVTFSERPWTILTFMFAQGGNPPLAALFSMAASMLWLWTFGYMLQNLSGNKYIFPIYIYGSIVGAVFFLITANALPSLSAYKNNLFLYSAQYGTAAIAIAVTTLSPQYRILKNLGNGIPVWVLTGLYFIISFVYAFSFSAAAGLALLGAALAGFLFIYLLRKDKDGSIWMHRFYNWCNGLFSPGKNNPKNTEREKVFYKTDGRQPYSKKSNVTQQRIDEILDKINQKGYQFLTDEEKGILKRASEEDL